MTTATATNTAARIYVGTYAKYNSGSIAGQWLDLSDYSDRDEFYAACAALHSDESDPEFMFQDWEGIPAEMVGESSIEPELWEVLEAYDEYGQEAVTAYISLFNEWDASDFQDRYRGQWDSWEDMAQELLDETGELDSIPEHLRSYFDLEAYARDMELNGDFAEENGYFFWNH